MDEDEKDIKPPNKKEDCMPEHLIGLYEDDKFIEYLSNIIKQAYKLADPKKQSFWATDTSRLVYIVRELIHTKAEWIYDKAKVPAIEDKNSDDEYSESEYE
jgi:hypothetical protein